MEFWQEQIQMNSRLSQVQKVMEQVAPVKGRFARIIKDLLANQGKMLRPALLILAAGFENEEKEPIHLAAALEFLHMASLVHDDIIDHSTERRGVPSVVAEHGTAMAIYTGDYLIYLAARSIASLDRTLFEGQSLDFMASLLEAEAAQLEERFDLGLNSQEYLKRIEAKTGLLFSLAVSLGFGLHNHSKEKVDQVKEAGLQFGVAFQLRDDLLDFDDPGFGDLKEGNLTLPVLLALKEDPSLQVLLDLVAHEGRDSFNKKTMSDDEKAQAERSRQRNQPQQNQCNTNQFNKNQMNDPANFKGNLELEDLCLQITKQVRKTTALYETKLTLQKHLDQATSVFKTTMKAEEFSVYQWLIDKLFGVKS